jgi:ligand-binding sensor domain-containing protein/serine phosphatase RsbU (regulator of sigma subunit)
LQGQTVFPDTRIFTVSDGLSQSHINTIIQDSRGFLWMGTENGLNRYDGYSFLSFNHQPNDSSSLSNNYINAISEAPDGNLWIATNKGLNVLNVNTGTFTKFQYSSTNINTISDNIVLNIYFDSQKTLWVKTLKSLDRFDPETKTFKRFPHYNDLFRFASGNIAYPICEDSKGRLWVGSKDGLNYFDKDMQLFNRYISLEYNSQSISNDEVLSMCPAEKDQIWIGTANGLNLFNPETKTFKRFFNPLKELHIFALLRENNERLWIGALDGLYIFNIKTETFEKVNISNNQPIEIPVFTLKKDNSGIIWAGSLKGLIKIKTKKKFFQLYKSDLLGDYSFSSNDISSLFAPDNNYLWVGTWSKGLNILNRTTQTVTKVNLNTKGSADYNNVHCTFQYTTDQYWFGTNNGIVIYNSQTKSITPLCQILNVRGCEVLQNRINVITRDAKGRIWVGTFHGLYQISPKLDHIRSYLNNPDNSQTLCNNTIYCLSTDRKGRVWIGTENGLDCMDPEKEKFEHYSENVPSRGFLSNSTIYCLQFDISGYLWIGTSSGLNRLDLMQKKVKVISEKDGLSDNLICAIQTDNKDNIWVSTHHGINKIDHQTLKIRVFDTYDGLQDYEYNLNASCRNAKGELFFGGISGINSFFPDSISFNTYQTPVVITSIEAITHTGVTKTINSYSNHITIPYETPIFTINFAALDFTIPEKNNFAYKFYSGEESDWVKIGKRHSQTFSNLKPGRYHFKLIGSNNDLTWSEKEVSIIIDIEAPIWLKPEAYYVYVLLLAMGIFAVYRYRTHNLRLSNRLLKERERTSVEIERQKELLAQKNKNITDSIKYAKRIQEALMPSDKAFKKVLPESFVFHQPKDIVSGDFFWISERANKVYVAAADCTGHGVPGAFMSIIGFELFRKITHNRGVEDPSEILNILNHEFEEIFRDVEEFIKDGMDIAFCVIDKQTRILEFAGAVNPIYLIRDNKITEIRGSRFSVGLDENIESPTFENKQIVLQPDDLIYLFSDGYADQFGGPEGKKFKYRRFRHLLLTLHQYPIEKQHQLLEERINQWKGNLEQVDDILVIGFKPVFNS